MGNHLDRQVADPAVSARAENENGERVSKECRRTGSPLVPAVHVDWRAGLISRKRAENQMEAGHNAA